MMDYLIVKTGGVLEIDEYRELDEILSDHRYSYDAAIDLIMAGFTVDDVKICVMNNIPAHVAISLSRYHP